MATVESEALKEYTKRYMASWNEHIDQLMRLGYWTTPDELKYLNETVAKLRELATKCETRSRDNQFRQGELK